jgi:hypothetical protein
VVELVGDDRGSDKGTWEVSGGQVYHNEMRRESGRCDGKR